MDRAHAPLLAKTTPAFQALHEAMAARVKSVFPDAKAAVEFDMPAWIVPVAQPPPEGEWKGTMPRTHITIGPTEKKAGITLHVWHPLNPYLLRDEAAWLKEAGFKVMVGCLQWNRKAPLPLDAFERLMKAAKKAG